MERCNEVELTLTEVARRYRGISSRDQVVLEADWVQWIIVGNELDEPVLRRLVPLACWFLSRPMC